MNKEKLAHIIKNLPICEDGKKQVLALVEEIIGETIIPETIFQVGGIYKQTDDIVDNYYLCIAMSPGYNLVLVGKGAQIYGQTFPSLRAMSHGWGRKFRPVEQAIMLKGV